MPRPPRISGRYPPRRSSSVGDDDDTRPRVNPAAVIAIVAVVVGVGLLIWVMGGGPTHRPVMAPPPEAQSEQMTAPVAAVAETTNGSPRAEIRVRIDPRTPALLEYSGSFSTDADLQDEDLLTYRWDFGDGTTDVTAERGTHLYRTSGSYAVRLQVRDPAGAENSALMQVEIAAAAFRVAGRPRDAEQLGLDALWVPLQEGQRFAELDAKWGEGTPFTVDKVDLDRRPRDERYALRFSGFLMIPAEGIWTFFLTSDDGSRLLLDGKTILNMDDYQAARTGSISVEVVSAGLVPFRLDYYQGGADQELAVDWIGPGLTQQRIPASAFVRPAD